MPRAPLTIAAFFTPQVRTRGERYFREGRVRLRAASSTQLDATVRGSRPYTVSVSVLDDRIATSCTCPYAEDFDTGCKHVWATVLAAADAGHPLELRSSLVHGHPVATGRRDRGERHLIPGPEPENDRHRDRRHDREPQRDAVPRWRRELDRLRAERAAASPFGEPRSSADAPAASWPTDRRVAYIVDTRNLRDAARVADGVVVELATQKRQAFGGWAPPRRFAYTHAEWLAVPDADDREIAQMLLGAREAAPWEAVADLAAPPKTGRRFNVRRLAYGTTLRRICATGRAFVRHARDASAQGEALAPLRWDDGAPWRVELALVPHGEHRLRLEAALVRDIEEAGEAGEDGEMQPARVSLRDVVLLADGLVVVADPAAHGSCVAARADDAGARALLAALADGRVIAAADTDAMTLAAEVAALFPRLAPVTLPASLGIEVLHAAPVPLLALGGASPTEARLAFAYDDTVVDADAPGGVVSQPERRRIVARDRAAESRAIARLERAGARASYEQGRTVHRIPRERVGRVAVELSAEGWRVSIDDRALRRAGEMTASVRSGLDWFDLDAAVDFGGVQVGLPALLAALRRGERTVALADGSLGTLPDEWVARWGRLALLGAATPDGLRFARGQAALLDALLAAMPAASTDAQFERARAALRRFDGFAPADAPAGFHGVLRDYQREGLGWLEALREVGLGGILADDMGLGKTVQVLALLERLRQEGAGPSLVVVPASIVFNWVREAARFAPALRVHVHHGAGRGTESAALADADLVVTTYGTLRRDAAEFRDVQWEYAILDEAQAIKNATTATAKAARLLRARHRLAVTGTPVENRLDELWSLFEFLNPGMLGASTPFRRLIGGDASPDGHEDDGLALVARIVRPYILRRTKAQVARELPERVEQTVWVDLGPAERKAYDELRDHYRASLLGRVETGGLARNKIHVLEALLRLRQAACHPGLIDRARADESSGKLDVLLARLAETTAEGHKTLVFSQFTTLLGIVRTQLDAAGVRYEYLDGRTRDRQARVDRFQQDPEVPVFLVSLKAGGVGLNLTAADYVFLLDPWWNPAVEAQAIDRAHRIGQSRRVIASRLVARDTVEEKVLLLQEGKRALADAVVRADEGMLRSMTREDLELLLG